MGLTESLAKHLKAAKKEAILVRIFLYPLIASAFAFFMTVLLAELAILGGPYQNRFFLIATILGTVFISVAVSAMMPDENLNLPLSTASEMRHQIRDANSSKKVLGIILLALSSASVYFAAQTILYASGNLQETPYSQYLEATKRDTDSLLAKLERDFAAKLLPQSNEELVAFKAKREALAATSARLNKEIIEARTSSETVNSDGTVKQIFVFQFISSIIVRLGTLGIILLLFGVALRQYRRYDRQILELRQVHLAISLAESGKSYAELKTIRDSVSIDDDAKAEERNTVDKAFMEGYSTYVTTLTDKAKSLLETAPTETKT